MILNICSVPEVLKVMRIVKLVISIIKIVVPILLILSLVMSYLNAVNNPKELKKVNSSLVPKSIAAVCIFFVPTFVNIIIGIVSPGEDGYATCLNNATSEGISKAYYESAKLRIAAARKTLTIADFNNTLSYVQKNVKDKALLNELESELGEFKQVVELSDKISKLSSANYKYLYKELKSEIEGISDPEYKAMLEEKLALAKENIGGYLGDYPIVPFGEDALYTNLKYLSNQSLESLLASKGSSVEELNEKIYNAVDDAGEGTREAAVAASITLIGSIAEYGYRLPYFWGGKRYKIGVDGSWGLYKTNSYCNDYYFKTQAELDHCNKEMSYWGMDCSGFVSWAVNQSTRRGEGQSVTNNGKNISLNSSTASSAVCDIGDALGTSGHIVLVVGLDDDKKRYIIAEESSGMEIRSVNYDGSRPGSSKHYYCIKLDHNYTD